MLALFAMLAGFAGCCFSLGFRIGRDKGREERDELAKDCVPTFALWEGNDNRPVVVPVWMASTLRNAAMFMQKGWGISGKIKELDTGAVDRLITIARTGSDPALRPYRKATEESPAE